MMVKSTVHARDSSSSAFGFRASMCGGVLEQEAGRGEAGETEVGEKGCRQPPRALFSSHIPTCDALT